jgi:hypothetical protein
MSEITMKALQPIQAGHPVMLGVDVEHIPARDPLHIPGMLKAAASDLESAPPSVERALALLRLAQEVRLYRASLEQPAPKPAPKPATRRASRGLHVD